MLVFSLQFARFGASGWRKSSIERDLYSDQVILQHQSMIIYVLNEAHLQPWKQLVSNVHGCVQGVVGAPLLSQGHAQVLHLFKTSL